MKLTQTVLLAALLSSSALAAQAQTLRIGLESDPDALDPDRSRTFVGRIVFTALCDKLIDVGADLSLIPQLATEWSFSEDGKALDMTLREGVVFHDGTPFDAAAVKANIERSKTLDDSVRKTELSSVESVEVLDATHVRLNLSAPDAPLLAQLADRAGIMLSPSSFDSDVAANPVCSGPFKFVSRVAQDKIELEKFGDYWNADAIKIDRVTYLPIPDSTVRLANLQSGDLDLINRLAATDAQTVENAGNLVFAKAEGLGYQGITFNIMNGAKADNPFGKDARLRDALSLSIDRAAINQVVFAGLNAPASQFVSTASPYFDPAFPVPARDIEKAKALIAEAGVSTPLELELQFPNRPESQQVVQMIQAMAAEAGINISLSAKEFATMLTDQKSGDFQASQVGWSGRIDPDGNITGFVSTGGGFNDGGYSNAEIDRILAEARAESDVEKRKALYHEANVILNEEQPLFYLYNEAWLYGVSDKVAGFTAYSDGMIRLENIELKQ
ncbi:ABC transporter substrate-binding protein [Paracoccus fistulariae]|uniref:ABC transporter substrate-binding protein n=1 Tax=Paracoccus fistulariae TaxID=658446 RepID=A0ABY7SLI9_9RHOB|nr:ABC transporter substrate-binding protein [Paracoccus fistulariae]MDB6179749.1 ABC transporter substrate-binding protein [Paracoccus fistulariae]WCR07862.1 ABC transporter substrate-binding protein [Paracoccus fistulariae]